MSACFRLTIIVLAAFGLLIMQSCSGDRRVVDENNNDASTYFPLESGLNYRLQLNGLFTHHALGEQILANKTIDISILETILYNDENVYMTSSTSSDFIGSGYYILLTNNEDGICAYSNSQLAGLFSLPVVILPRVLVQGDVIYQSVAFDSSEAGDDVISIVQSIDETFEIGSETHEHCVLMKYSYNGIYYNDSLSLDVDAYFRRGIGLVRLSINKLKLYNSYDKSFIKGFSGYIDCNIF